MNLCKADPVASSLASSTAHEFMETITDTGFPRGAWRNIYDGEIGDPCADRRSLRFARNAGVPDPGRVLQRSRDLRVSVTLLLRGLKQADRGVTSGAAASRRAAGCGRREDELARVD